jgi:hypothetical protein
LYPPTGIIHHVEHILATIKSLVRPLISTLTSLLQQIMQVALDQLRAADNRHEKVLDIVTDVAEQSDDFSQSRFLVQVARSMNEAVIADTIFKIERSSWFSNPSRLFMT